MRALVLERIALRYHVLPPEVGTASTDLLRHMTILDAAGVLEKGGSE